MQELKERSRASGVIRRVFKILVIQTVPKAVPHKLQIIQGHLKWLLISRVTRTHTARLTPGSGVRLEANPSSNLRTKSGTGKLARSMLLFFKVSRPGRRRSSP